MPRCHADYLSGGRWRIFREPEENKTYIVGVDTASGKMGANESVINVECVEDGHQCALLGGKISPDDIGVEAEKIGYLYHEAEIVIEAEFFGATVIAYLREVKYPKVFYQYETATGFNETAREYGWWPRRDNNRQVAIDWLQQDMAYSLSKKPEENKRAVYYHDPETILQFGYFVRNKETGKFEASQGKYDDRVSAAYISNFVRRLRFRALMMERPKEQPRKERTFLEMVAEGETQAERGYEYAEIR
jgi:hypothetical protein